MDPKPILVVAAAVLALAVLCSPAAAAEKPADAQTIEQMQGELTAGQKALNVVSFPFRMIGYMIYYPLKFLLYDLWVWLYEAIFGSGEPGESDFIDQLDDKDRAVRIRALRRLGDIKSKEGLEKIIPLLAHPDSEIRSEAVVAVGRIGSDAESNRIIDLAKNGETLEAQTAAIQALGLLREGAALQTVSEFLTSPKWFVRYHAANALGNIGNPAAGPPLVERLRDPDPRVRASAAGALANIGDPRALPYLMDAFRSLIKEGTFVRANLVAAVGALGGEREAARLLALLSDAALARDAFTRGTIAHVLGEMGYRPAAHKLGTMLLKTEEDKEMLGAAAGLAHLGELGPLFRAMKDKNPYRRLAAALGCMRAADPEAVPYLEPLAEDPFTDVRRIAILALLSLGQGKTVNVLIDQLRSPDLQMRHWALETLKSMSREDHGLDAVKWKTWWRDEGGDVNLPALFRKPRKARRKLSRAQRRASRAVWDRYERKKK